MCRSVFSLKDVLFSLRKSTKLNVTMGAKTFVYDCILLLLILTVIHAIENIITGLTGNCSIIKIHI